MLIWITENAVVFKDKCSLKSYLNLSKISNIQSCWRKLRANSVPLLIICKISSLFCSFFKMWALTSSVDCYQAIIKNKKQFYKYVVSHMLALLVFDKSTYEKVWIFSLIVDKRLNLCNYWWAGISNYVYSTILLITKIYIFLLLYFISVLLFIIRSQPMSILWTVTSTAVRYDCWSYIEHCVLWMRCVLYIWY